MSSVEEMSTALMRPSVCTDGSDEKLCSWWMTSVESKIVEITPTDICGEVDCDCVFHHAY